MAPPARGDDTPWSDLEMLFVIRDGVKIQRNRFIYRGISVGYRVIERGKLEELLADPSLGSWPFSMGILSGLKILYGDPEQVASWLQLGQSTPTEKFRAALEAKLPGRVVESYGKIHSCRERHDTQDVKCAVFELLFEISQFLCFLNQRWVTHGYYQGLVDTFDFPKLPEGYTDLIPALWSADDINKIVPLAETLVSNFWRLLADEGIHATDYRSLDDVQL